MEAIIIHPENKEQSTLIENFLKSLNVPFTRNKKEGIYDPEFVNKILEGDKDFKEGKGRKVSMDELISYIK